MSKSLLEELPKIVREGKKTAERILEQLEGRHRVSLQTRELVIPARDTRQADLFRANVDSRLRGNDDRCGDSPLRGNDERGNSVIPAQAGIQDANANASATSQVKSSQVKCCIS